MTSPSLTIGTALLAFSPTLTLLFLIILPKPQLTILSVVAAFAYLLSAFGSSLIWLIVNAIFQFTNRNQENSIGALLALTVPSVLMQWFVRMQFVKLYFGVEDVIRKSVAKHEAEESMDMTTNNTTNNTTGTHQQQQHHAETNALQLQLNDLSCSLASGTGYALLHTLFLFGTLLASESHESNNYYGNLQTAQGYYGGGGGSTGHGGTLYQNSCSSSSMPSLVNGALVGCMFSILDVVFMMLTFFGMRRRQQYYYYQQQQHHRGGGGGATGSSIVRPPPPRSSSLFQLLRDGLSFCNNNGINDTIQGGNAALGLVIISHLMASLALAPNGIMEENGCQISLPCLAAVVVLVVGLFWRGVKGHFLPVDQRERIQELRLSGDDDGRMMMMGGSGGGGSYHND
ncbi:hypothetical protein ACHAWT_004825 [Skeletonema menzelii]